MSIKELVTKEQYVQLSKEYNKAFPLRSVSFFDFCTKIFEFKIK